MGSMLRACQITLSKPILSGFLGLDRGDAQRTWSESHAYSHEHALNAKGLAMGVHHYRPCSITPTTSQTATGSSEGSRILLHMLQLA